ncbi:MAG: dihydrodipicolinate synthase family protein, partial [Pseudomonadota bacterium]
IPQVAGVGLPIDVVQRLRTAFPEQIVGIKDSSGVWENTSALLDIDGLIVYPGSELPLIEAMDKGAPGCISATANLNAPSIASVIETYRNGDRAAAASAHEKVKAFRLLLQDYAPIPAQKRLLAMAADDPRLAVLRPPLEAMSEEAGRELAAALKSDHGFEAEPLLAMA